MIGAVSAASDANATAISSDVSDTHTTHTDTNTQVDKTNSNTNNDNDDNIIAENKEPLKLKSTNNNNNTNNLKKTKQTKNNSNILTKTDTDTNKLKETNVDSWDKLRTAIDNNEEYIILTNDITGSGIAINTGKTVTINGDGHSIDANNRQIFYVKEGATLILENLKLINGKSSGSGGAIYNQGTLNVTNCTFTSNTATYEGGAIYNEGTLTVTNTTFTSNTANNGDGGAIYNRKGTLTVTNTTFNRNTATNGGGGAIYNQGTLTVTNTTFNRNTATHNGGAIFSGDGFGGVGIGNGVVSFLTTELFDIGVFHAVGVDLVKIQLSTGDAYNGEVWVNVKNSTFNQIVKVNVDNGKGEGTINLPNGNTYTASINVIKDKQVTTQTKEFNTIYDTTSFAALNDEIKKATDNSITLNHNYTYNEFWDTELKNGIPINTKITINGNGHTINATQQGRIFNIASIGNLTLINCTLTGGQLTFNHGNDYVWGGAIYTEGTLTIINSTVKDNTLFGLGSDEGGRLSGGAIYNKGTLTIMDSNITNNEIWSTDKGSGGAIANLGTLTINNSNITDNQIWGNRYSYGGAIYTEGTLTIMDSKISNNNIEFETEGGGRAIYDCGRLLTIINTLVNNGDDNIYFYDVNLGIVDLGIDDGVVSFLTTQTFDINVLPVFEGENVVINLTNGDAGFEGEVWVNVTNATFNQIVKVPVKNSKGIGTIKLPIGKYNTTINIINNNYELDKISKEFMVIGNNSFTALYNNITKLTTDTLTLTHNYTYDNRTDRDLITGIPINKTITINGNGYAIDGNNTARIFNITNQAKVTINNITLTKGKAEYDGTDHDSQCGGAIFIDTDSTLHINNTTFTHNTAAFGGAIYTQSYGHKSSSNCNVTIINSQFNNNRAYYGGAIYANYNSQVNITHTNINNNNATVDGGAISAYNSQINITHTNITHNNALSGGAIYADHANVNINNAQFTHNTADDYGGAIYAKSNSQVNITHTNINNNNATYRGGAIYATSNSQVNISYTSFIKNTAKGTNTYNGGGAIYAYYNSTMVVSSSLFMNNTASNNGGAIYGKDFNNLTVNNNIFLNNTRNKEIYLYKEDNVDFDYNLDCNWFGNNETNHINNPDTVQLEDDIDHSSVRFDNWLFLSAKSTVDPVTVLSTSNITFKLSLYNSSKQSDNVSDFDNGLLYPVNLTVSYVNGTGDKNVRLGNNVTFKPDTVGTGSVTANISNVRYTIGLTINKEVYDTKITDLSFDDLFEGKESLINGTLTANNTGFANQEITINITNDQSHIETYIGKTDNNGKFSIKIKPQVNGEVTITINYPGNQTDKIIYKPTTNTTTQTITLNKTSYKYLQTQITEALNNNKNNLTLNWDYKYDNDTDYEYIKGIPITTEFTIYGNNHTIDGNKEARIFKVTGNGDLTLINITLTQGKGQNDGPNNWNVGGAIYTNNTNLTLINATLTENTAENEGGAIYTGNNCKINITNTIFNKNQVTKAHGGAIYATGSQTQINITKSLFNNNTANKGNGGAIYAFGPKLSIQNSTFNQNTANHGGAIYAGTTQINIKQTLFNNNTANHGGAINSQYGAQININNTLFNNNTATQSGGAIIAIGGSKLNINNTVINNNTATQSGGAIYAQEESTKINIKQTLFNNNTATWGGAIYTTTNTTLNIKQTLFNNNSAGMGGAIYTTTNTTLNIKQTLFNNNTANYGGSIAASDTSKINMIQTVLSNNTGLAGGAICIQLNCTLKMTKSLFDNNSASIGGAICTYINCTLNMTESLFDNNTALNGTNLCMLNGGSAYIKDTQIDEKDIYNNKTTTDSELARIEILTTLDKFKFNIIDFTQDTTTTISITEPNGFNGTAILIIGDSKEKVEFINGLANIKLNLKPGTYTATITDIEYYNDPNRNLTCTYLTSNNTTQFTVNNKPTPPSPTPSPEPTPTPTGKVATKILAKQKTFKLETKNKKYTITLKDTNGNTIKKAKVTLKVKGKTYKATTNNKGKATFKITKLNKKGKYTAKIQYKGNKKYKATTKKIKLTVKTIFKTIGKNSKNKKMIKKIQKALKKNGYYKHEGKRYLKIDGIYHKWTTKAVKQYQKDKKLQVTGTVNYQTAKKLKII